jgi:hypothetical protein
MSSYEFDNDIDSYRGLLEYLEINSSLIGFTDHKILSSIIKTIDQKYQKITQVHPRFTSVTPWWKKRILTRASSEYFETLG